MPVQKIKAGRVVNSTILDFIGEHGTIFYDEGTGQLRLSDGSTPGGIPLFGGGGGGAQGVQGAQGRQGAQGAQGIQGTIGAQGITGAQGAQGFQGIIGVQGSQGFQGITGAQGAQGFQGTIGVQGSQGFQGVGGGSDIAVLDHGTVLTTSTTSFNFTGTGVIVTAVGGAINVNIASSTGSGIIYVGNFDGGQPNSNYGGITSVDAGGVLG